MPFMNFWLSVNLFANLFMILFRKSRSFRSCIWQHLYKSMHDQSYAKTRVHKSFTLLMCWVFFNRNWPSILYQDPTCINALTLRFKWNNPCPIITAILLHACVTQFFSVGNRSIVRKIFFDGANLVSGSKSMWPGWEHVVVIHYIISLSYIIHVHFYLFN